MKCIASDGCVVEVCNDKILVIVFQGSIGIAVEKVKDVKVLSGGLAVSDGCR